MTHLRTILFLILTTCALQSANIFPKVWYDFWNLDAPRYMFLENKFAPIHMGGSALLGRVFTEPRIMGKNVKTPERAMMDVFMIGLWVEYLEVIVEGTDKVYGSDKRWLYDTLGDISCNMIGVMLSVRYVGQRYSINVNNGIYLTGSWEL